MACVNRRTAATSANDGGWFFDCFCGCVACLVQLASCESCVPTLAEEVGVDAARSERAAQLEGRRRGGWRVEIAST